MQSGLLTGISVIHNFMTYLSCLCDQIHERNNLRERKRDLFSVKIEEGFLQSCLVRVLGQASIMVAKTYGRGSSTLLRGQEVESSQAILFLLTFSSLPLQ